MFHLQSALAIPPGWRSSIKSGEMQCRRTVQMARKTRTGSTSRAATFDTLEQILAAGIVAEIGKVARRRIAGLWTLPRATSVRVMFDPHRPAGIVFIGGGLVIRAEQTRDDVTVLVVSGDKRAGAVARGADGWHFDASLRASFSIDGDPVFDTDMAAVNHLTEMLRSEEARVESVRQRLNREALGLDHRPLRPGS